MIISLFLQCEPDFTVWDALNEQVMSLQMYMKKNKKLIRWVLSVCSFLWGSVGLFWLCTFFPSALWYSASTLFYCTGGFQTNSSLLYPAEYCSNLKECLNKICTLRCCSSSESSCRLLRLCLQLSHWDKISVLESRVVTRFRNLQHSVKYERKNTGHAETECDFGWQTFLWNDNTESLSLISLNWWIV